jgi:hypothetical protein
MKKRVKKSPDTVSFSDILKDSFKTATKGELFFIINNNI